MNSLIKLCAIKDLFGIQAIVSVNVINYAMLECKCRKILVDKLVKECIENVEEVILAKITSAEDQNKHKNDL